MNIRISTFGGVAIHRDGRELVELPAQALRCALLVYLAVEGETTRDAVMAMFWPRRKAARARHSLNQTVYQLRGVLGQDVIQSHGDLLRLGAAVAVDATEFERAVEAGRHAAALDLYQGPFLEGDPIPAGSAFAAWTERQRALYGGLHRTVRRERIRGLLEEGDEGAALARAREWARMDPLDGEAQHQLTTLLRRPTLAGPAGPDGGERAVAVAVPPPHRHGRGIRLVAAAVLVGALAAVLLTLVLRTGDGSGRAGPPVTIGVLPFAGLGMPPDSSASIQDAFVSALEWPRNWRAVDAGPMLRGNGELDGGGEEAVRLAQQHDFRYLLTGEVGAGPGVPGLQVSAWDVGSGDRVFHARAESDENAADASARMAYQLLSALSEREGAQLPLPLGVLHGTSSATARGHFLRGRQLMDGAGWPAASDAFLRSAAADPHFGHAWFRAGFSRADDSHEAMFGIAEDALRRSAGMAPRAIRLIQGLRHYALRDADEAITAFERLVQEDPQDADAWFGLAMSVHHLGAPAGHDPARARTAFDRLLALDSGYAAVHSRAFDLALAAGNHEAAAALLRDADVSTRSRRSTRSAPAAPAGAHESGRIIARQLVLALVAGSREERAATLDTMRWQNRAIVSEAARVLISVGADLMLVDSLGVILQESIRTPSDRRAGGRMRLVALVGLGNADAAMEAWASTSETTALDPFITVADLAGVPLDDRVRGTSAAAAPGPDGIPDFALAVDHPRRVGFRAAAARAALHGDSADVAALIRAVRDASPAADQTDPLPATIEAALLARQALVAGDTTAALEALNAALSRPAWPHLQDLPLTCMAPQRLLAALLHTSRAEHEKAARWARTFGPSGCLIDPLFRPALSAAGLTGVH